MPDCGPIYGTTIYENGNQQKIQTNQKKLIQPSQQLINYQYASGTNQCRFTISLQTYDILASDGPPTNLLHYPDKPTMILNIDPLIHSSTSLKPLISTAHQCIVHTSWDCATQLVINNYCTMQSFDQVTTIPTSTPAITMLYISSTTYKKAEKELLSLTPPHYHQEHCHY